jgi:hypothetical protein
MSDQELLEEVRHHQRATWRRSALLEHAKKHQRDLSSEFGQAIAPAALKDLTSTILRSWDLLFTELDRDGMVSYLFVRRLADEMGIVVVCRAGRVRTLFVAERLDLWKARHPAIVEVTDRVKRLAD